VAWIKPLDSTVSIKPQIVKNHTNGEKEIFVEDDKCRIYLFDKNGGQAWKKQLPEPVKGEIMQIDAFNNEKLQYLFATEHFLHLIDRKGNYVDNFPVKLPESLSAEISVFDYEHDGNYRIFVPCTDKKLYVYTKDGALLDSWQPFVSSTPVITPVQYFNIRGSEYLVFGDMLKTYILNRRGNAKINVTNNFPKTSNTRYYIDSTYSDDSFRFVTTNSSGGLQYITLEGGCKTVNFKHYSAEHCFVLDDIDRDGKNEYIFSDDNAVEIFSENGKMLSYHLFDSKITYRPIIFSFSDSKRIGIICGNSSDIYLLDSSCKICKGFPLKGTTGFSITLFNGNDKYNLLTGHSENCLYNYFISVK